MVFCLSFDFSFLKNKKQKTTKTYLSSYLFVSTFFSRIIYQSFFNQWILVLWTFNNIWMYVSMYVWYIYTYVMSQKEQLLLHVYI